MTLLTGLDHILIEAPAGCEDAARTFFGTVLELTELQKPAPLQKNGGVWFALPDGRQLHIGVTPDFQPRLKGHAALRTSDVNSVKNHLTRHDIPFKADEEAGVPRVFLHDPWGNRLEIVQGRHESQPLS